MDNIEKRVNFIKNPLGIIALLLILVEAIASLVISFSSLPDYQNAILIVFIAVFPFAVLWVFFLFVSKYPKNLYSPGDFQNEENYVKLIGFNSLKGENEEFSFLWSEIKKILENKVEVSSDGKLKLINESVELLKNPMKSRLIADLDSSSLYEVQVVDIFGDKLINDLIKGGYNAIKYSSGNAIKKKPEDYSAIWVGKNVDFDIVKNVIRIVRNDFPFIKYLEINGDFYAKIPDKVHNQIIVGGETKTAVIRDGLTAFNSEDFEVLYSLQSIEEIHEFIRSKY